MDQIQGRVWIHLSTQIEQWENELNTVKYKSSTWASHLECMPTQHNVVPYRELALEKLGWKNWVLESV